MCHQVDKLQMTDCFRNGDFVRAQAGVGQIAESMGINGEASDGYGEASDVLGLLWIVLLALTTTGVGGHHDWGRMEP